MHRIKVAYKPDDDDDQIRSLLTVGINPTYSVKIVTIPHIALYFRFLSNALNSLSYNRDVFNYHVSYTLQ